MDLGGLDHVVKCELIAMPKHKFIQVGNGVHHAFKLVVKLDFLLYLRILGPKYDYLLTFDQTKHILLSHNHLLDILVTFVGSHTMHLVPCLH